MILLIDNYDSFTYNLAHQIEELTGLPPHIIHNDDPYPEGPWEAIIISPGPGNPECAEDLGSSATAIGRAMDPAHPIPILGVCLGHQAIAHACGARIAHAPAPIHGLTEEIESPWGYIEVMRYHSLAAYDLPDCLIPSSWAADGTIMSFHHRDLPAFGVQFHPESVGSPQGHLILEDFFAQAAAFWSSRIHHEQLPQLLNPLDYIPPSGHFMWLRDQRYDIIARPRYHCPILPHILRPDTGDLPFELGWVGYRSYEGEEEWAWVDSALIIDKQEGCSHFVYEHSSLPALPYTPDPAVYSRMRQEIEGMSFRDSKQDYIAAIRAAQDKIRDGESYEVCLTTALTGPAGQWSNRELAQIFDATEPTPYGVCMHMGPYQALSFSPEEFVAFDGRHIQSRPIKGTLPAESSPTMGEKERAENLMIVDLVRHDLGQVCDRVYADSILTVETHGGVHQLISTIEGDLNHKVLPSQVLDAAFPPGSMTGAPKKRTMEIISSLETAPRGLYSGTIGMMSRGGRGRFNVVIRSLVAKQGYWHYGVGGAITALSTPEKEWEEVLLKTRPLRATV